MKPLEKMSKEKIINFVNSQPIKVTKNLKKTDNKFSYNENIMQYRERTQYEDEELVRMYPISKLANELGYSLDRIVLEKEYEVGRPKTVPSRIDIIVKDKDNNAFLFIETKSPLEYARINKDETIENQLYNLSALEKAKGHSVKYLVLYTINEETLEDECIIIDSEKQDTFSKWQETREATNILPVKYGKAQKVPYVKNSKKDLRKNFSTEYLSSIQKDLHNVLWGGGGTDDNEIFSSLVNLILAKIQDEGEKEDGEQYEFQSLTYEKDGDENFESNEELFNRINKLYRKALKERMNITDNNEINKSYVIDTKKFSLSKLKYSVQQIEHLSFVDGKNSLNGKDILGDFFEGIIRDGFKQTKGQFFTPINIVKFMLWGLSLDKLAIHKAKCEKRLPYMIDPSAGSGTFCIEYMKFITHIMKYTNTDNGKYNKALGNSRDVKDKVESDWFYPDNRENKWAKDYIYATEINFNLGTATKVNMILHGDGSTNIFVKDGLLPFSEYKKTQEPNVLKYQNEDSNYREQNKSIEVNGKFDVILSNPPFSVDLDNDTKNKVFKYFLFGDKKNSENLFIERYYQLLGEKGRLAVVLPESIFDTIDNKYIRLFIFKYFNIKAVISLPRLTFAPYTSTKTSILFAQKKTKEEIENWKNLWNKISNEYSKIRRRVDNIIKVFDGKKEKVSLHSIKNLTEDEERELLVKILKNYYHKNDINLSKNEIIEKYKEEILELCKDGNKTKDISNFASTWWIFGEVAKELNYNIFMAEVDEVGYKRSVRNEQIRPNELFRTDENKNIIVDDGKKETVLDYMREIEWE